MKPSGVRFGTPALTTRGMKEGEIKKVVEWIDQALVNRGDDGKLTEIKNQIKEFTVEFPIPSA
jgi:glycine hydroxymethyltransferase